MQCALDTSYWTGFNHFVIWGSILFYFGFTFAFYSELFDYTYLGTAVNVMGNATFWFTVILAVTVLLVPVAASRFYRSMTRPTLADRVRLKQRIMTKSKSKSGELILRHASHRRSQRSFSRSGYAFAHEEGFGELITTGSMMRTRKRRTSTASSLKSCFPIVKPSSMKEAAAEALRNTMTSRQAVTPDTSLADNTIELTDLSESVSPRSVHRTAAPPSSLTQRSANISSSSPTEKTVTAIVEEPNTGRQRSPTSRSADLTTVTEQPSTGEPSSPQHVTVSDPLLTSPQRIQLCFTTRDARKSISAQHSSVQG